VFGRLSVLRLFLSLSVVFFHLLRWAFPQAGYLAVLAFFFISGFLIAQLLSGTYRDRAFAFVRNRALRIFPAYWACALLNLLVVVALRQQALATNEHFGVPSTASQVLHNVVILGLLTEPIRLCPPAWSLHVELIWYALLLGVYASPRRVRVLLLALLLPVPIAYALLGQSFYGNTMGSGFAFALGALWLELQPKIPRTVETCALAALPLLMFALPSALRLDAHEPSHPGSWLNAYAFPFVLFVAFGFFVRSRESGRLAYWAGAISYPLFLIHWSASVVVGYVGVARSTPAHAIASALVGLLASVAVVVAVERPLQGLRARIRMARPA